MKRTTLLSSLLVVTGFACTSGPQDKGPEDNPLSIWDAKADAFFDPTEMGKLNFDFPNRGEFTEDTQFLAYDFQLTGESTVSLETIAPPEEFIDTVMYLYRKRGNGEWGSFIAKNDDFGGSLLSFIEGDFGAGEYRLIVKTFIHGDTGRFSVLAGCDGSSCPTNIVVECQDALYDWTRDCVREERELDRSLSYPAGLELCTDSPFAGLGDEPGEVFDTLCGHSPESDFCSRDVDFFVERSVPACVAQITGEFNGQPGVCPVSIEDELVSCAESFEDGTSFEEGMGICAEFTSEMHEDLCRFDDGSPDWCTSKTFDQFVDNLLAQCLHDFLS